MPDVPEGSIVITPKEFYDGVRQDVSEIKAAQARIEGAIAPLPERVSVLERKVEAIDQRQDDMDKKIAYFAGAAAALGALAGSILPRILG